MRPRAYASVRVKIVQYQLLYDLSTGTGDGGISVSSCVHMVNLDGILYSESPF